jgi:guanylate kinase
MDGSGRAASKFHYNQRVIVKGSPLDENCVNFKLLHPEPLLVIISGPSGVGKDAVLRELRSRRHDLHIVVTATSRPKREGEVEGVDYIFLTREEFKKQIEAGEFIEYATVYQDYKGCLRSQVTDAFESGQDAILRVDYQGALTYRGLFPEAVLVFLVPENPEDWLHRLKNRGSETEESLRIRLGTIGEEIKSVDQFDYVVCNEYGKLQEAVDQIEEILRVEHLKVHPRKIKF